MKTLNDIEIIIINGKINYNYKGLLYTKAQFEEKFLNIDNNRESPEYARVAVTAWEKGERSGFYTNLIQTISKADLTNKARSAAVFPAIVEAYDEYMKGRL